MGTMTRALNSLEILTMLLFAARFDVPDDSSGIL